MAGTELRFHDRAAYLGVEMHGTRSELQIALDQSNTPAYNGHVATFRAIVVRGKLLLDEPTDLPEGTVVELSANDSGGTPRSDVSLRIGETVFGLKSVAFMIGRDPSCDLVVEDTKVSRYHALLVRSENSYLLFDFKSVEGVLVNDKPILRRLLEPDDRITIGSSVIVYVDGKS